MSQFSLSDLASLIESRTRASAEKSYTKSLLESGPQRIAKKFGEEAVEAIIAAISGDKPALINESADVLYHLLVLLKSQGIELQDIERELERRTTRSGLEEKAERNA